jgi:hypothetical protein
MGCPALGVWVAFLKQPDALTGRAPIFFNYFWFICDLKKKKKKKFLFGVLYQAVRAVSKKQPKPPMLDIPFSLEIAHLLGALHPQIGLFATFYVPKPGIFSQIGHNKYPINSSGLIPMSMCTS